MEELIYNLIEQHGVSVVYLVVLLYIAQTIKRGQPTESLQSQFLDMAKGAIDKSDRVEQRVDRHDAESRNRDDSLLAYLKNQDTLLSQALLSIQKQVTESITNQIALRAGQDMLLGAVSQGSQRNAEDFAGLTTALKEVASQMTADDMNGKLDQVLAALIRIESSIAEIKPEAETLRETVAEINNRLDRAEKEVTIVKHEVVNIKKRETGEDPPAEQVPPTGSPSKTQARHAQESPDPPQETNDNPLTDATASGG